MSSPIHLHVLGLGPSGAVAVLRARQRGWRVTAHDPRVNHDGVLPEWPATYGVLDVEVPAWARPFTCPSTPLRAITEAETVLPFCYAMVDKSALRAAVEAAGASITASPCPADASYVLDCTGAPVGPEAYWQVAVGRVLPMSLFGCATIAPIFMDWSQATSDRPASFLYVQHVDDGVLFEETVLATRSEPESLVSTLEERLYERVREALPATISDAELRQVLSTARREFVAFPMGTRKGSFLERREAGNPSAPHQHRSVTSYFGAAGGLVHPATGYSLGASMMAIDQVLDGLMDGGAGLASRKRKVGVRLNAEVARLLRRLGAELIARADGTTLRSFFTAFFSLTEQRQLAYLTGHNGLAVARTMWALRRQTGFRHPFLLPLWQTPRQVLRAAWKK